MSHPFFYSELVLYSELYSKWMALHNTVSVCEVCEWMNSLVHELRTPNEAFCHRNPKLLANLSAPILVLWVPCPCFTLIHHYCYKKTKPLYPNPKYLFGIGIWIWIWIWAPKNWGFSHRVSVVRACEVWQGFFYWGLAAFFAW